MTNSRVLLAEVLAAVSFVLILLPYLPTGVTSTSRYGLYAIALSTASFFVGRKQGSFILSGLVVATGIVIMAPSTLFFITALPTVTGSVIGILLGAWVLALGITIGRTTLRAWGLKAQPQKVDDGREAFSRTLRLETERSGRACR